GARRCAIGREGHADGTNRAHVEVRRRSAWAAVEDERDRPRPVGARRDVRDGEDLGGRLLLLPENEELRRRGVVERLVAALPGFGGLGALGRLVFRLRLRVVGHELRRYRKTGTWYRVNELARSRDDSGRYQVPASIPSLRLALCASGR